MIHHIIRFILKYKMENGFCIKLVKCMEALPLSHVYSVTLWTVAHQAPLSMEFSRQEYWS